MTPAQLLELEPSELWGDVWHRLGRAARDPRHSFRPPVVATLCPERGVRARTVVLRESDPEAGTLTLHTDRRAGKLAGLDLEPRVSGCFYDPRHRVQVRAETRATVHAGDAEARTAWESQGAAAHRLYAVAPAPGSALPGGWQAPARDEGDAGFENFAAVRCAVEELECLQLAREGHRRLHYRRDRDGSWRGTPVVP